VLITDNILSWFRIRRGTDVLEILVFFFLYKNRYLFYTVRNVCFHVTILRLHINLDVWFIYNCSRFGDRKRVFSVFVLRTHTRTRTHTKHGSKTETFRTSDVPIRLRAMR